MTQDATSCNKAPDRAHTAAMFLYLVSPGVGTPGALRLLGKIEQDVALTTLQDTFGTLNHHSRVAPASVNCREIMGYVASAP